LVISRVDDLSLFLAFLQFQKKAVILSEALRRSIANRELYGAEPKDPGEACLQMLTGVF
jgi:hypothetical protein